MQSHEIDYEIKGAELQLVEITLDPDETVVAEAGAMTFLEEGIEFKTKMGDGADSNIFGALGHLEKCHFYIYLTGFSVTPGLYTQPVADFAS